MATPSAAGWRGRWPPTFAWRGQAPGRAGGRGGAMAADIRIARQGAAKIGMPEVALGVLPGTGGTQRFARLVGKARAIELMATGALFSFEEAEQMGLVNHVWGGGL